MDSTEKRSSKRSRFDQTEREYKRFSGLDRRSRSPPTDKPDLARERSPSSRNCEKFIVTKSTKVDPATTAAVVAAKISQELMSRKGGCEAESMKSPGHFAHLKATASASAANIDGEIYMSDGDYIKDIEINDLRNRYIVTNASNQKKIKDETGADVTTRGKYLPDKSMASPSNPPLYLHITSTSREGLESAIAKVKEMIQRELPPLVDERRFRRRDRDSVPIERDEYGRRKWPEHKIPISLESLPGFNLRAQVVGHSGAYVKHIQQETGCRVQIKGQGSGFIESSTGRESDEPMFLHVAGPDASMADTAKTLCEDLLQNVREQYESFKNRPQRPYGYSGYGERHYHHMGHDKYPTSRGHSNFGSGRGSYGNHNNLSRGGYNSPLSVPENTSTSMGLCGTNSTPATMPGSSTNEASADSTAAEYVAQYAQYYGTADPYAPYGGYAAYVQYYQQYYAATQQAQTQPGSATPSSVPAESHPRPSEAPAPPSPYDSSRPILPTSYQSDDSK